MLILREQETNACLEHDPRLVQIMELLEQGYRDYVAGNIVTPPGERIRMTYPPGAPRPNWSHDFRMLPAFMPGLGTAGMHIGANVFDPERRASRHRESAPDRRGRPNLGSHAFLWDFENFQLVAVIADSYMHSVRAGSPSGLATKWLARKDARTACCIGSGSIMQQAITAVCGARPIESVKVFSPTPSHREDFARGMSQRLDLPFTAVASAEEAVRGVDIVQIVTNSHFAPVIDGAWLEPGQHVNSVAPGEIDERSILRSKLFVGTRDRTLHDNPPRQPLAGMIERGVVTAEYVQAELGEIIVGKHPGRTSDDEITLFLSPGVGFYDLAIATWVYRIARQHGLGTEVEV